LIGLDPYLDVIIYNPFDRDQNLHEPSMPQLLDAEKEFNTSGVPNSKMARQTDN
jgi:hypothetical protein